MKISPWSLLSEVLFTRPWIRISMLGLSLLSTILGLAAPFLQREFIENLPFPEKHSLPHLFLIFFCLLGSLALYQIVIYLGTQEAIWMQRRLAQRLYDHTLSLQTEALHGRAVGEFVSVYTIDVPGATILLEQSLPQGFSIFIPLMIAPWVLVTQFHVPVFFLSLFLLGLLILNFSLAYRQSVYFFKFKHLAAKRVGFVNEWIQNIRVLRILDWIPSFEQKIFAVRKVETRNRISMLNNGQTMNAVASSMTFILNVCLIALLISIAPQSADAGTLLALLWIVGVFLTRPFRQMPWFFTFVFDAWTSLKRVSDLLGIENRENQIGSAPSIQENSVSTTGASLEVHNLNLESDSHRLLGPISFQVASGEFIAIVGPVGSGKSLLLASLLGETGARFDQYLIDGKSAVNLSASQVREQMGLAPQESFMMSASLRENIAFEYDTEKSLDSRIEENLRRSQFDLGQEKASMGLETEVGERGVNLSGGQRQRLSLARLDFRAQPILLLDDTLSAVDVDTEKRLIESLLQGSWKNRTRLLVTHRLSLLPLVDRIFFMNHGNIETQGSFTDLMQSSASFRSFVASIHVAPESPNPELR